MHISYERRFAVPGELIYEEPERFVGLYVYHVGAWYRIKGSVGFGLLVLDDDSVLQVSPGQGQVLGKPEEVSDEG